MLPPKRNGFTLIEMMIVIAIFVISAAATVPLLNLFNERQTMATMSIQLMQTARRAQSRSLSGMMGMPWNVYVGDDFYVMFAGDNYNPAEDGDTVPEDAATGTVEIRSIKEPINICTGQADGLIAFPVSASESNTSAFIRLYSDGEDVIQRFILIDTVGAIRVADAHPDGLTCAAP